MKKTINTLLAAAFFLMIYSVYAQMPEADPFRNSFYSGDVLFTLDKSSYSAGEEIKTNVSVANMENFPLTDVYVVVEIVRGEGEHVYPSQSSDADNVIYEETVGGFILPALSQKTIPFSYRIPEDLDLGAYRFEVYALTKTAPIAGLPSLFLAPRTEEFVVAGGAGYLIAHIERTQTYFSGEKIKEEIPTGFLTPAAPNASDECLAGPLGVGVIGGEEFSGKVFIKSDSVSQAEGLKLKVSVCKKEDSLCYGDDFIAVKEYCVPPFSPGKNNKIDVSFEAPKTPGIYSIRLELFDGGGRLLSLYRSKVVVKGETAKIAKLNVDKLYYAPGSGGTIKVLVFASPDIYDKPTITNSRLSVSITGEGKTVYSDYYVIPSLSLGVDDGILAKSFKFNAKKELLDYNVCAKIESGKGLIYDEYCFFVKGREEEPDEKVFSADLKYDSEKEKLNAKVCSFRRSGRPADSKAAVILISREGGEVVYNEKGVKLSNCADIIINAQPGDYSFLVNDEDTSNQFSFEAELRNETEALFSSDVVCGDNKCTSKETKEVCCIDCGCPKGFKCTNNTCMPQTPVALCGDGRCTQEENSGTCCVDCGCAMGECVDGECTSYDEGGSGFQDNIIILAALGALVVIMLITYFYGLNRGRK